MMTEVDPEYRLSKQVLFFGGRRRLVLYHQGNGAVLRVRPAVLEVLRTYVPEIEAWKCEPSTNFGGLNETRERLLRWRVLVPGGLDEEEERQCWYPARAFWSAFYVGRDEIVLRARHEPGQSEPMLEMLDPEESVFWLACDGRRSMRELTRDLGLEPDKLSALARTWTRWDRQLLKWLPQPLPELVSGGLPAEFVSHVKHLELHGARPVKPCAETDGDLHAYYRTRIRDAAEQFDSRETTVSHLFRVPHAALKGRSYAEAMASVLRERGALCPGVRCVVEVGAGTGDLAAGLTADLASQLAYVIVEPSPALIAAQRRTLAECPGAKGPSVLWVEGCAEHLPLADASVNLLLANEVIADLAVARVGASGELENIGALQFLGEIARVLAPGGTALLTEYGACDAVVVPSDALDHAEHTIRFDRLLARAGELGLEATLEPLRDFLQFDSSTTLLFADGMHLAELRALAQAAGRDLPALAYTPEMLDEALGGAFDVRRLGNLAFAPLERLPQLGLVDRGFQALLLHRPEAQPKPARDGSA